jgi:hypothetical protein
MKLWVTKVLKTKDKHYNFDLGIDWNLVALPLMIGWERWDDGFSAFFRFLVLGGGVEAFSNTPPGEFVSAKTLDEMLDQITEENKHAEQ